MAIKKRVPIERINEAMLKIFLEAKDQIQVVMDQVISDYKYNATDRQIVQGKINNIVRELRVRYNEWAELNIPLSYIN
jgi:uncharacterized protein YpuA (DUF1002 family)